MTKYTSLPNLVRLGQWEQVSPYIHTTSSTSTGENKARLTSSPSQKELSYPKILVFTKPPTIAGKMDTRIKDIHPFKLGFKGRQKKIALCISYDGRCIFSYLD